MNTISLTGCNPTPLASYLKALGILRILAQQCPKLRPQFFWHGNTFYLKSSLDEAALTDFFLNHYSPSPVVAPWNGGSGFYPKDKTMAVTLKAIAASEGNRFVTYRKTVTAAQSAIDFLQLTAKPEEKETKERLLLRCRNTFSESALEWLDSAFVLTGDGAKYPPLLGTGGNDGRLEFTNNFMQRLIEVLDLKSGTPFSNAAALLENALFDTPIKGLADKPIGQFSPAASGGANASTGFDAKSAVNPWDFILALEGAMLFAAAAVKRLEGGASGQLVYPFCVQSSGTGYGSSADADENESRCEIWMPLWGTPAGFDEIKHLFSEGRAWVKDRPAKNGVDFARAVVSLGVDRGIVEFQRYGFHVRNGLAYFATPLQRLLVQNDEVIGDLLAASDSWIDRFLSKAKTDTAPSSIHRAANRLETAILAQAAAVNSSAQSNAATVQELLIALGECECALAKSGSWRKKPEVNLRPIPPLPREWIKSADDNTAEYRLAAALASLTFFPLRRHFEPVNEWAKWDDSPAAKNEVIWHEGDIVDVLCAAMKRRLLLAQKAEDSWPDSAKISAWPCDIAAFIEGRIDEKRFTQFLWGLCLVDFSRQFSKQEVPSLPDKSYDEDPPAFYAQLKLCFARLPDHKKVPIEPIIFNLAANGDGERASRQALRRLHGSNVPVTHILIPLEGQVAKRSAAALLFPLLDSQLAAVGKIIAPDLFQKDQHSPQTLTT